jgi:hypothetical protein
MTESLTELDLVVGSLITVRPDEDRAAFEEEHDRVSEIQDQLRQHGIAMDLLAQPGTEVWEGGIESAGALYQLSRLATRLEQDDDISTVLEDGPVLYDELDRAVTDVWDDMANTRFPHLVNLQGIYSYYLPVDFATPIWLPMELPTELDARDGAENGTEEEAFFGSSVRLQQELTTLREMLHQAGVPVQSDAFRCLNVLHEAATHSVNNALPIIVW